MTDTSIDHKPFLSEKFDVHDYAKAVLEGRQYRPDEISEASAEGDKETVKDVKGKGRASASASESHGQSERGDVGAELAKLNYGIEEVTRQLRQEITTSYPLLLDHLTTSMALSSHLSPIRSSLGSLSTSLDRLQAKIHTPHEQLALLVKRLNLLAQASDLTRRAARFVLVARRLEGQMKRMKAASGSGTGEGEKDRELAKAALSVAELDSSDIDPSEIEQLTLQSLDFVKAYTPIIDKARDTIIQEMESMVVNGLADLNQPLLSSSLQTAHNLRLLPDLVSNLLADLNDAVTLRITRAFDSAAIGREVAGKESQSKSAINFSSRSRPATEPTSANQQQWVQVLWARLERVIEDVANCCIKVYTLEKVLKIKKDPITQTEFLEEVMKVLDEKPSFTFWTTLAKAFEVQTKEAARSSGWLQQALSSGYPRLLRLFHDFFAKIAVHTDTVYTRDQQSTEAVLVLRSISTFETLYLSRSTTRMNEAVSTALHSYLSSPTRGTPPGPTEGINISRVMTNELDSAKFDPLLVRTVARNGCKVLDGFLARLDGMVIRDFTATSLVGPHATPAQTLNNQVVGCLYHVWYNLTFVEQDFPGKVWETMSPCIEAIQQSYKRITSTLDTALRRDFSSIIARIHKVDFGKAVDTSTGMGMGMGMGMDMGMGGDSGASPYMQELSDKIGFVRGELLGRMSLGEEMREWILSLSRYLIQVFLLHASIVHPLSESGKLKLTTDMTELEVAISSLLTTGQPQGSRNNNNSNNSVFNFGSSTHQINGHGGSTPNKSHTAKTQTQPPTQPQTQALKLPSIGEEYLALRSFRTILFSDLKTLANPVETIHLPPLVILHHIMVLSGNMRLPHQVNGWTEVEYVGWVMKHDALEDRLGMVEKAMEAEQQQRPQAGEKADHSFVKLLREVLEHARHVDGTPGI